MPFWTAGQALAILEHKDKVKQRPPGALDEVDFLDKCTGCDACMAACPHNLIFIEDLDKRDPIIYPQDNPCLMCASYPCISACETWALELKEYEEPKLRLI